MIALYKHSVHWVFIADSASVSIHIVFFSSWFLKMIFSSLLKFQFFSVRLDQIIVGVEMHNIGIFQFEHFYSLFLRLFLDHLEPGWSSSLPDEIIYEKKPILS